MDISVNSKYSLNYKYVMNRTSNANVFQEYANYGKMTSLFYCQIQVYLLFSCVANGEHKL